MVKDSAGHLNARSSELNNIFQALSDLTRRKILERLAHGQLTVSEIKQPFRVSLVAISKHIKVLERAKLIRRQKMGREHVIHLHPQPLCEVYYYIETFKKDWTRPLDALEKFVERNRS